MMALANTTLAFFRLRSGLARSDSGGEMGEAKAGKRILLSSGRLKQGGSVTLTNWVEIAVLVIIVVLAVRFFQKRS